MIDFDLEVEKLCQINIREKELNGQLIDDKIKKSIILYNMAIKAIEKGGFHIAINDLKKAIAYNRDFIEAIKILGLCYVNMNEYKQAKRTFKKLSKYGAYDELVNEYLESLSIRKSMYEISMTTETVEYISNNIDGQFEEVKYSSKKIIISLLVVILVIGVIVLNYFSPKVFQEVLGKFKTSIQSVQEKFHNNKTDDKSLGEDDVITDKTAKLSLEPESIQKNSENIKLEGDNYKIENQNMLSDAENFLNSGNYEKAANILISMTNRNFDDDTKSKFNQLLQSLKPNGVWAIYDAGNKLYKQNKYSEALPKLLIVSEIDPNLELMPWITFQIGMCYKETNDNANALLYFNKVKDNYSKSQYVSNAKMMIHELGN